MEEFPEEAVKNNILGTYHSALAAINNNVGHFVFVSTDKAVNPRSVMGATKRVSERIILSMNAHEKTRFILTRFGNVLGSRGSVIPTFVKQIDQGGPVTITHPEIERYFMSIPEASRLVIKAATLPQGKIFVLNMGKPIKILDLAKNLIKLSGFSEEEIPITFTGLRKGEKIQEELFTLNENLSATRFDKLMISQSEQEIMSLEAIATMIEEFKTAAYAMDQNQVRRLLKKYVPEFQGMLEN
jgi:FlaA1/EpsC-like NDP-sugar epimerase